MIYYNITSAFALDTPSSCDFKKKIIIIIKGEMLVWSLDMDIYIYINIYNQKKKDMDI